MVPGFPSSCAHRWNRAPTLHRSSNSGTTEAICVRATKTGRTAIASCWYPEQGHLSGPEAVAAQPRKPAGVKRVVEDAASKWLASPDLCMELLQGAPAQQPQRDIRFWFEPNQTGRTRQSQRGLHKPGNAVEHGLHPVLWSQKERSKCCRARGAAGVDCARTHSRSSAPTQNLIPVQFPERQKLFPSNHHPHYFVVLG